MSIKIMLLENEEKEKVIYRVTFKEERASIPHRDWKSIHRGVFCHFQADRGMRNVVWCSIARKLTDDEEPTELVCEPGIFHPEETAGYDKKVGRLKAFERAVNKLVGVKGQSFNHQFFEHSTIINEGSPKLIRKKFWGAFLKNVKLPGARKDGKESAINNQRWIQCQRGAVKGFEGKEDAKAEG